MARLTTKKTKTTTAPIRTDEEATTGSQAEYDLFLPAAREVLAAEIVPMRADPVLALQNLQTGVTNVLAELARLEKLPETDVRGIEALPRIALAVIFACTQIASIDRGQIAVRLGEAMPLRGLLMKAADALAEAGLFKKAEVAKIREGHGKLDAARDLVALAALFQKHWATIRGKHAITAAQIKQASEVGTALIQLLKPGRAKRAKGAPAAGTDERDRLWTLVVQGHDRLWRAGAYLFGRDHVDEKVPPLLSGRRGRPKKAAPPV